MSWLFSRALVEDFLPRTYLDGEQSALSNWIGIAAAFSHSDRMTDSYDPHFRYGMTFVPLTADRGAGVLMSFLAGSLAKHTAAQLPEKMLRTISGRKCDGSWQMSLPGTYLPRTSQKPPSMQPQTTLNRWVTKPEQLPLARQTWVATTFGKGIGYLHTPTTKANYCAPSMQKWKCAKAFVTAFGKPTPENHEWLMGWPIGWTDLRPLETDRFQSWQQQHGIF